MTDQDLEKYYEILELESGASANDLTRAYNHLKKLYSSESMATQPIDNEWNETDKQQILERVEEAYAALLPFAPEEKPVPVQEEEAVSVPDEYHAEVAPVVSIEFDEDDAPSDMQGDSEEISEPFTIWNDEEEETAEEGVDDDDTLAEEFIKTGPVSGEVFRQMREKRGLSIDELSESTQIPAEMVEYIEQEDFAKLPDAGYLRWFITTYAKTLSIDPRDAADEYMKLYREWKKNRQ
ncbi:MAG: helix-turn-helix domain-containing protein [bacterium]|nr:helix-turn-helix domain-containing protein [bacterium]